MKTKIRLFLGMILMWAGQLTAQDRTIVGKVTSYSEGKALSGVKVVLKGKSKATITDYQGNYILCVPGTGGTLVFSLVGMKSEEVKIGTGNRIDVALKGEELKVKEEEILGEPMMDRKTSSGISKPAKREGKDLWNSMVYGAPADYEQQPQYNTEEYDAVHENIFQDAIRNPLSTFSIDVDAASYSNVRRFINSGQRPPKDAVRIEEMVNYFDYDYDQPKGDDPFAIYTEIAACPWNMKHKLVHIGLQGRKVATENLPPSNLVFLIDVSGSMSDPNKLPLLKSAFKMLVEQLRSQDRVAIVVYAGAAGLVLPSTSGADKKKIIEALDNLEAGGSTAGGAGINLAYVVAKENFRPNGNNRIILATDGDFNIGESSNASMERLIEEKRKDGVFLTVLGFGMGNYKDSKMETIADKGNGNYAYIDSILEAQKVLVNEFGGTLFTIAKDVKLQIEFNPVKVRAYRLIGYENRMLKNEDFNNDKKDAGDLGSGHTVTALYEIIPVGVESDFNKADELKYQAPKIDPSSYKSKELMTVKFRYKKPAGELSKLIVHPLLDSNQSIEKSSNNFRWSAAVAGFGMLLRESEYVQGYSFDKALQLAQSAKGLDKDGYRIEFINMVKSQGLLASR
jgi:Ca-activated chloride channel homolog